MDAKIELTDFDGRETIYARDKRGWSYLIVHPGDFISGLSDRLAFFAPFHQSRAVLESCKPPDDWQRYDDLVITASHIVEHCERIASDDSGFAAAKLDRYVVPKGSVGNPSKYYVDRFWKPETE